ncbi:hypothetical protein QZH41_017991, partial [Actinostola sp. cb2023]
IFVTGIIGFAASLPVNEKRTFLVPVYSVLSIVSTLLSIIITDCYIVSLVFLGAKEGNCQHLGKPITMYYGTISRDMQCEIRRKIAIIMIIISLCEVFGGISAIYCCIRIYKSKGEYHVEQTDPNRL